MDWSWKGKCCRDRRLRLRLDRRIGVDQQSHKAKPWPCAVVCPSFFCFETKPGKVKDFLKLIFHNQDNKTKAL